MNPLLRSASSKVRAVVLFAGLAFCVGCREDAEPSAKSGRTASAASSADHKNASRADAPRQSPESSSNKASSVEADNGAAEAAAQAPSGPRPNLWIITIDTLRADHLRCYGYFRETSPNIDALAAESLFFENCISPVSHTLPSHTSLFTGVYPIEHGIVSNLPRNDSVYIPSPILVTAASAFKRLGYATAGFVSAMPVRKQSGIAEGFDTWHEPKNKVRADVTRGLVEEWLNAGPKEPFFLWTHFFDPHDAYEPPPPFDTKFDPKDPKLAAFMKEREVHTVEGMDHRIVDKRNIKDPTLEISLYDGEVAYCDAQLGVLFDAMKKRGLWDKTAILFTADHGEGLGQHGLPRHGGIWLEQLHVPLLMKLPGRESGRFAGTVSMVDVLPSAIGALGVQGLEPYLAQFSGRNVLAPGYEPRPIFAQVAEGNSEKALSVVYDHWRLIHDPKEGNSLFDLKVDPYELKNVAADHPDVVARIKAWMDLELKRQSDNAVKYEAGKLREATQEEKQGLTDLGYVESEEEDAGGRGDRSKRRPSREDE